MLGKSLTKARLLLVEHAWKQTYFQAAGFHGHHHPPLRAWTDLELPPVCNPVVACHNRQSAAAVAQRLQSQVEFPLIFGTPFTLGGALQPSNQARVVTEFGPGTKVIHVNKAWEELCGFTLQEVRGSRGLKFIQGPNTELPAIQRIQAAVQQGGRVQVLLTNYKKNGESFRNHLQVTPLLGSTGRITHLLGILREIK